jgi:hypothetical protein
MSRGTRLFLLLSLIGLSGCSSLGVEPWQRDVLSQPDMQFGAEGLTNTFSQHFYFSKEASSGGQGFAGGGCGCN